MLPNAFSNLSTHAACWVFIKLCSGPGWLLWGFHPAGVAVSFTHAGHPCSQICRPYIERCHQQLIRLSGSRAPLSYLFMQHHWHSEPGHQSGWSCRVWKLATEFKVTFIIRQKAVSSLYFMFLLIFDGALSLATVIEQAAKWVVTAEGRCMVCCCGFWVFYECVFVLSLLRFHSYWWFLLSWVMQSSIESWLWSI